MMVNMKHKQLLVRESTKQEIDRLCKKHQVAKVELIDHLIFNFTDRLKWEDLRRDTIQARLKGNKLKKQRYSIGSKYV